jgi:hypothetical protein
LQAVFTHPLALNFSSPKEARSTIIVPSPKASPLFPLLSPHARKTQQSRTHLSSSAPANNTKFRSRLCLLGCVDRSALRQALGRVLIWGIMWVLSHKTLFSSSSSSCVSDRPLDK